LIARSIVGAGFLDRGAQPRVAVDIAAAQAGRHRHLAQDLGEDLAALGVDGRLLALDRAPFAVTRHRNSSRTAAGRCVFWSFPVIL